MHFRSSASLRWRKYAGTLLSRSSQQRRATILKNEPEISYDNSKIVANWLFGTAGAVALMVSVGGVTRLTRSGLSMTDWKLQGSLPPMNQSEWEAEFSRYKQYPEFNQRKNMKLDEFKYIYFWEYSHRMFGRMIGLIYGLPLVVFSIRGMIPKHVRGRAYVLLGMGGMQGLVGWWMVKSGLNDEIVSKKVDASHVECGQIRVSPYRLAAHLGMAFTTFALLVSTGLDALKGTSYDQKVRSSFDKRFLQSAIRLRRLSVVGTSLAFVTAFSGAFVAGNDAGHAYNLFPWMTYDSWLPAEILQMKPLWRNFFENTATVQASHRVLAMTTLGSIGLSFWYAKRGNLSTLWANLPSPVKNFQTATVAIASGQVSLGITTLLLHVPIPLAVAHQVGALALLGSSVGSLHALKFAKKQAKK